MMSHPKLDPPRRRFDWAEWVARFILALIVFAAIGLVVGADLACHYVKSRVFWEGRP